MHIYIYILLYICTVYYTGSDEMVTHAIIITTNCRRKSVGCLLKRPSPLFANLEPYMLLGLACQQVKEQSNSFRHCPWRFNARTRGPCFAACLNPLIASHPWLTRELPT